MLGVVPGSGARLQLTERRDVQALTVSLDGDPLPVHLVERGGERLADPGGGGLAAVEVDRDGGLLAVGQAMAESGRDHHDDPGQVVVERPIDRAEILGAHHGEEVGTVVAAHVGRAGRGVVWSTITVATFLSKLIA